MGEPSWAEVEEAQRLFGSMWSLPFVVCPPLGERCDRIYLDVGRVKDKGSIGRCGPQPRSWPRQLLERSRIASVECHRLIPVLENSFVKTKGQLQGDRTATIWNCPLDVAHLGH